MIMTMIIIIVMILIRQILTHTAGLATGVELNGKEPHIMPDRYQILFVMSVLTSIGVLSRFQTTQNLWNKVCFRIGIICKQN